MKLGLSLYNTGLSKYIKFKHSVLSKKERWDI